MECRAKQYSDQMSCVCGNVWDMNDLDPPECKPIHSVWTQADAERENAAFTEWFKERGYPNYPDLYPLTTENAMHSAWQEAAKRASKRRPQP